MAAANTPKKYCNNPPRYNPEHLRVLFYNQELSGKNKTILSNLNNEKIDNPVKAITKAELQNVIKEIYLSTCGGIIDEGYITKQMVHNKIIMILFDTSDRTAEDVLPPSCKRFVSALGKPVSFILGHINNKDYDGVLKLESYIDIICACPGSGRYLLNYFIAYSESNNYTAVSLSALPGVLTYYPKFGFSHRHSCKPHNTEVSAIKEKRTKIINENKVHINDDNIYDDDDYFEFFKELRAAEFGKTKEDCDGTLTKEKLKKGKCDNDGYMMRRCK
jgi:hypothetical protein